MKEQPQIGIFWVFKSRLMVFTAPLEQGSEVPDGIDSPFDHVHRWPDLQRQHPELRDLEYQDVPRGRVLFLKTTSKFSVYMDKSLHKAGIKNLVLEAFALPKSKTVFLTDPHYTTDPNALERMFSRDEL